MCIRDRVVVVVVVVVIVVAVVVISTFLFSIRSWSQMMADVVEFCCINYCQTTVWSVIMTQIILHNSSHYFVTK